MRRLLPHSLPALASLTLIIILLPLLFPSAYYYRIGALVFIFALAAVGLNLLMGFAGQVSLGHAGFLGIGGYAVAIGPTYLGVPAWLAVIVGGALSGLLAYLVGRPILGLKGHYLAVATLGLGLLIAIVLTNEVRLDRRAGWHVGAAPCTVRVRHPRGRALVLAFGRHLSASGHACDQPGRQPERARAAGNP